jgi:hypothetical protein
VNAWRARHPSVSSGRSTPCRSAPAVTLLRAVRTLGWASRLTMFSAAAASRRAEPRDRGRQEAAVEKYLRDEGSARAAAPLAPRRSRRACPRVPARPRPRRPGVNPVQRAPARRRRRSRRGAPRRGRAARRATTATHPARPAAPTIEAARRRRGKPSPSSGRAAGTSRRGEGSRGWFDSSAWNAGGGVHLTRCALDWLEARVPAVPRSPRANRASAVTSRACSIRLCGCEARARRWPTADAWGAGCVAGSPTAANRAQPSPGALVNPCAATARRAPRSSAPCPPPSPTPSSRRAPRRCGTRTR